MPDNIERLQQTIESLRTAIEWFKAPPGKDPGRALQQLREVRMQLTLAGDVIGHGESLAGEDLRETISQYRDCLQRLQEALAFLHSELTTQRSSLQPQREQIEAAMQWASCGKSILG